jgi:transposase
MRKRPGLALGPGIAIESVEFGEGRWVIRANARGTRSCPSCGEASSSRHSAHGRRLQDFPIQGIPAIIELRLARWRCRNDRCTNMTFVERLPALVAPFARRTLRLGEIIRLFGHAAGGRVSEGLLRHLAMPASRDTVLRGLKKREACNETSIPLRIAGIDDWCWQKGETYGTIIVDLERRTVADVLPVRSTASTQHWLKQHPGIEVVSRDRCGLYAQATRQGAPQARQVADRFHLLQNLKAAIERQMARVSRFPGRSLLPPGSDAEREAPRHACREARLGLFQYVKALHAAGMPIAAIKSKTGVGRHTLIKWIDSDELPARRHAKPTPRSPAYFRDFLEQQWAAGNRRGRHLLHDLRNRGYTGSHSHLARFLAEWRRPDRPTSAKTEARSTPTLLVQESRAIDPLSGWQISPQVAAALCLAPTGTLTPQQELKVTALKQSSPSFVVMRRLAMRFRGLFRSGKADKLEAWLRDAKKSAIPPLQQFARTLQRDLAAVRNAITLPWSNGQVEGQINRLKTLKRAMYGRAGVELLRIRMMPFEAQAIR